MEKLPKFIELPVFLDVEQLMADTFFLKCLANQITDINNDRDKVSEGGTVKLKRNHVTLLIELGIFNEKSIASEYLKIHYKRSVLPGMVREFISYLVAECVDKTFKHYEVLSQKQNKKTLKSKKNVNN